MINILYSLISGLMFKIRGGLKIKGKKLPLCKWWFAVWFACYACILKGWSWKFWLVMFIASRMATCICGWGEAVGCALGMSKPDKKRQDYLDFDEFCDNFQFRGWKLIDHPQMFGVVWLTLRGILLTFLIGLALNSISYMICGCVMGVVYWVCGWFARNVKSDGKSGWHYAEILFGTILGIFLWLLG